MSVTFLIFLDTRRIMKKTQKYPLKLRVTANRVSNAFGTIHQLTEEEYSKLNAPRISAALQQVRDDVMQIETLTSEAIKKLTPFDFWVFRRDYISVSPLFLQKKLKKPAPGEKAVGVEEFDYKPYHDKFPILTEEHDYGTVASIYCEYIKQLIAEKRLGNALSYRDSCRAIVKQGGKDIRFADITVSWLRGYEATMLEKGRSRATVGIILRALRCIFNEADHRGVINKQQCYPFGRRKYLIPTSTKRKCALDSGQISTLYYDVPSCDAEKYAKALWFFMYFGNGMNPRDLAHLKYRDLDGDYLSFHRGKTDLTARNQAKPVTVYINEEMHQTIKLYGNKDRNPNNYVFPILDSAMTDLVKYDKVTRLTHNINSWMKKIGKRIHMEIKPTTIVTRHSFSTVMKRSGASTEFIQEALGHQDKKTTENYLGAFENEVKKQLAQNLLAFKDTTQDVE